VCAGGSAGSGADGRSSGIADVFSGVLRGLGTLASSLPARPLERGFCCSCAPPRRLPGPCRSHHRHPSPGHPPASISTVLTRTSAVGASFLPFPCALCAGLVRRLQRPMRLRGLLEGRQKQQAR
jgi:hypothetical protein